MRDPWVVYVVVLGTVAGMIYAKHLIFFGDKETDPKSKDKE